MLIECCDDYKLIQLYQKSSEWCFTFSRASTFELIPSVASVLPGAWVTIGAEYGSFPVTVGVTIDDSRCRQRAYNVVSTIGGETVLSHAEQ